MSMCKMDIYIYIYKMLGFPLFCKFIDDNIPYFVEILNSKYYYITVSCMF